MRIIGLDVSRTFAEMACLTIATIWLSVKRDFFTGTSSEKITRKFHLPPQLLPGGITIGKGKARKPYEFGVKAAVVITHRRGLMVGARTFPGNPYDGHLLAEQLEQTSILLEDLGVAPREVYADLGFRGVEADNPGVEIIHRGKSKTLTAKQRRWLKRRQAVEPAIGHAKLDHRMARCWLRGATGDALHAVLCAAGYNIRWLLRAITRLGLKPAFLRRLIEWLRSLPWAERRQWTARLAPSGGLQPALG